MFGSGTELCEKETGFKLDYWTFKEVYCFFVFFCAKMELKQISLQSPTKDYTVLPTGLCRTVARPSVGVGWALAMHSTVQKYLCLVLRASAVWFICRHLMAHAGTSYQSQVMRCDNSLDHNLHHFLFADRCLPGVMEINLWFWQRKADGHPGSHQALQWQFVSRLVSYPSPNSAFFSSGWEHKVTCVHPTEETNISNSLEQWGEKNILKRTDYTNRNAIFPSCFNLLWLVLYHITSPLCAQLPRNRGNYSIFHFDIYQVNSKTDLAS